MAIYLSLLISIIGLVVYAITKENAKVAEIGRIAYAMGLLAFLMTGVQQLIKVVG